MTTTVHLRDANANRVAQIDDVVHLEFVIRHQAAGSWLLDIHPDSPAVSAMRAAITSGTVGHTGIEVVRDGAVVLSGPVSALRRTRRGSTDRVSLSGPDDLVWLQRRLATPQPATSAPPYSTSAYDVRSGVTSTVMRSYVDANAGPSAIAARRVAGLTMGVDPVVGATLGNQQARYDVLVDLVKAIAIAGGDLGFKITSNGAGALVFTVYQPTDRTATVKFSVELGNLGDFDYALAAPDGNYGYGGGSGEGTARVIVEHSTSSSITRWGRSEFFRDRRDTSDTTLIGQSVDEELAKRAENRAVTITPLDTPQVSFGTHYGLGDKVTAVIDGVTVAEVVREVKLTYDAGGEKVQPTLATPDTPPADLPDLFADRRSLLGRVGNLERR